MLDVRRAGTADVAALACVLARAFIDDPVARFIFPDPRRRSGRLNRFFELQLRHNYLSRGEVLTDSARQSCAMWLPPSPAPPPLAGVVAQAMLPLLAGGRAGAARRLARLLAARHPAEPHWYLGTVGTDPQHQGRGLASSLLAATLALADEEAMPAYLECSLDANVSFYARRGFEVTEELSVPAEGPRLWLMWRPGQLR